MTPSHSLCISYSLHIAAWTIFISEAQIKPCLLSTSKKQTISKLLMVLLPRKSSCIITWYSVILLLHSSLPFQFISCHPHTLHLHILSPQGAPLKSARQPHCWDTSLGYRWESWGIAICCVHGIQSKRGLQGGSLSAGDRTGGHMPLFFSLLSPSLPPHPSVRGH